MNDMRSGGGERQKSYHDYGHVREEDVYRPGAASEPTPTTPHNNAGRGQDKKFPTMLHYILSELEAEGKSDIMGWMPHGRSFLVRDQKRMESEILPNWFRQKKFHSFQRQLNIYGFARLSTGPDKGSYYHEMFLRGKPFLCDRIVRTKIKGEGPRKPNNPETEPTLSLYPPMPPESGRSGEDDLEFDGEFDLSVARSKARRKAPVAAPPPGFTSSLDVSYGLSPADLSRPHAMPMLPLQHNAAPSQNEMFRTDLVGSGGGGVYPLQERDLYFQSLLNGPSLSAGPMGGGWMATGTATIASHPASALEASTVESLMQTTQLYLLQRRLQEQQLRPHTLPYPYAVLQGIPVPMNSVILQAGPIAGAPSVMTDSESSLRPTTTTDPRSIRNTSSASDPQERYNAQAFASSGGWAAPQEDGDGRMTTAHGARRSRTRSSDEVASDEPGTSGSEQR